MKNNPFLVKAVRAAMFASMMIFGSDLVLAQVKIGTNPTTIGASNNLEVEGSTAGRKTSIDKTTGQVTIADGTQGDGKILTSDANGASRWESATSAFRAAKNLITSYQTITGNYTFTTLTMDVKTLDQDNVVTIANGRFTPPRPGTYMFIATMIATQTTETASSIAIFKNGVLVMNNGDIHPGGDASHQETITVVDVITPAEVAAGVYYDVRANVNPGPIPGPVGSMTIKSATFSGTKVR